MKPITDFPTPEMLRQRYETGKGFSLDSEAAKPLLIPYAGGEAVRRYYQDAAIRAVFEALATGLLRVLLSLATGAGKTFIAVNLLKRISDAGLLRKALFVCDRDELRNQALAAFKNHFGSEVAEVYQTEDGKNHARNARIHIATYQTLDSDHGKEARNFFFKHFRGLWVQPSERRGLIDSIVRGGFSPRALQMAEEAAECDLYDVLGEVGYGLVRQTRSNRAFAFTYKHKTWLDSMPPPTAATVKALASQFAKAGTEALETPHIFSTPEVIKAGGILALELFGVPSELLANTKERLFAA